MRLHRLEVTAFGPFAGTVEIDLDALSEAGLFLLTGATGAGKTSVLDAVCFALYGEVPGDRGSAKRLRSDQAADGARPRVELELTVAARRFRLVRSPAWDRPKKRGTGTTTEQAAVVVSERVGGPPEEEWRTLSTRLDETGQLVGDLLGMTMTQFTQVAMLPQGRFQAFLRARSEDRHRLLQQLFRTGRFEDVEGWLRERRRVLRAESEAWQETVADLASRVSETALADPPDPDDWAATLLPWAEGLRLDAAADLATATESWAGAVTAEEQARAALAEGRALAERQERWTRAARERDALEARAEEHTERVEALAGARRAVPVVLAARRREASAADLEAAEQRVAQQLTRPELADEPVGLDPAVLDRLERREEQLLATATSVRDALPRAEALEEAESRLPAADRERALARGRVAELETDLQERPERERRARERLLELRTAAAALPAHRAALTTLVERRAAALEATEVATALVAAREEHLLSRERAALSHEAVLAVREARIESMASELAGALAVGACCPVCGSADHPSKARPGPGAADAAAERDAQRRLDDDKAAEHARAMHVRDLETRHALLLERADGIDLVAADAEVADLEVACREAARAEELLDEAAAAVDSLEQRHSEALASLDEARASQATAEQRRTALLRDVERLDGEVGAVGTLARRALEDPGTLGTGANSATSRSADELELPLDGRPDLPALHSLLRTRAAAVRALLDTVRQLDAATRAHDEAAAEEQRAALDAGFDDVPTALSVALPEPEQEALQRAVDHHRARVAAVAEVLADADGPDDTPAPDLTAPDLTALAAAHASALASLGEARSRTATLTERCGRLTSLVAELAKALAAWSPVREQLDLATQVSAFVDGRSADNVLQMRLSAYVLAWRLSQVVEAANERLARMSDQRYSLEHTGRRGAGETRGGLSLLVRDDWSGESRDPVTLSGGETFVVSLALALGLADVISQEAGGTELDTLFVDEGFGSLDADTLEDVMDTLDSLREGGRVVGVVSHVSEMRDRIPVQLHVTKGRAGSTVALRRGA